ncbi:MAG: high-affinity nickel-transport family protein [Candidatus Binataceae bacterium]
MTVNHAAPLGLALLGLLLGMRHSTDPDHVIAVTAILTRERRLGTAMRIGLVWGLGHTVTVLAVGTAIIVFKLAVPARVGLSMEFAVALVLILLGLSSANALMRKLLARIGWAHAEPAASTLVVHSHPHTHDGSIHRHPHVHADIHAHAHAEGVPHRHPHAATHAAPAHQHIMPPGVLLPGLTARRPLLKSFGVGLVHGLAGSAAIALLVLGAIPQALWASVYLVIFCVGVVLGMVLITTAIGAPFVFASNRMAKVNRALAIGSGLLSFGFGLFLAYQIGIVDGLFRAVPLWTPH